MELLRIKSNNLPLSDPDSASMLGSMAQQNTLKPDFSKTAQPQNPVVALDRLPPHSLEAEQCVLGSIFLNPRDAVSLCQERNITPEYFYDPKHYLIYQTITDMTSVDRSPESVDLVTLTQKLHDRDQLDQAGGSAYLTETATSVATAANLIFYIDIIREKYLLRQVIIRGTGLVQEAYTLPEDVESFVDKAEKDILQIRQDSLKGNTTTMRDAIHKTMEQIETIFSEKKPVTGLETGFTDIDKKTAGMHPANLIILAARPGMGKTAFAMNIAEHVAVEQKQAVAIFSLEMSTEELTKRFICSRSRINLRDVQGGFLDPGRGDFQRLTKAASELATAPIFIDDTGGLKLGQLMAIARRLKQRHDIKLLIVDYLQLLSSESRQARDSRQNEVSEISRGMKAIAKELNIPVIALSQLNRNAEKDTSNRPKLSDLRESGSIEQDADVVMLLLRKEYYAKDNEERDKLKGQALVIIAKQRNGPTGDVDMTFIDQYTRFENATRKMPDEDGEEVPEDFGD